MPVFPNHHSWTIQTTGEETMGELFARYLSSTHQMMLITTHGLRFQYESYPVAHDHVWNEGTYSFRVDLCDDFTYRVLQCRFPTPYWNGTTSLLMPVMDGTSWDSLLHQLAHHAPHPLGVLMAPYLNHYRYSIDHRSWSLIQTIQIGLGGLRYEFHDRHLTTLSLMNENQIIHFYFDRSPHSYFLMDQLGEETQVRRYLLDLPAETPFTDFGQLPLTTPVVNLGCKTVGEYQKLPGGKKFLITESVTLRGKLKVLYQDSEGFQIMKCTEDLDPTQRVDDLLTSELVQRVFPERAGFRTPRKNLGFLSPGSEDRVMREGEILMQEELWMPLRSKVRIQIRVRHLDLFQIFVQSPTGVYTLRVRLIDTVKTLYQNLVEHVKWHHPSIIEWAERTVLSYQSKPLLREDYRTLEEYGFRAECTLTSSR